jgi:hypothetical protein
MKEGSVNLLGGKLQGTPHDEFFTFLVPANIGGHRDLPLCRDLRMSERHVLYYRPYIPLDSGRLSNISSSDFAAAGSLSSSADNRAPARTNSGKM